jgi:hypothetical protein
LQEAIKSQSSAMSRQVYLLGVGLVLVALAFTVCNIVLMPPIHPQAYQRILKCRTVQEVEVLLGPASSAGLLLPTGEISGTPAVDGELVTLVESDERADTIGRSGRGVRGKCWRGRVWLIDALYSDSGSLISLNLRRISRPGDSGPLARLRAWLSW